MPNRIVRESWKTSPNLNDLSDGAETLLLRLITTADDFGRFNADPRVILGDCYPLKIGSLKLHTVLSRLKELIDNDLAMLYEVNGRQFGSLLNFEKYNNRRAKHSKFPPPKASGESASTCAQVRAMDHLNRGTRNEESRNEERGIKSKDLARPGAPTSTPVDDFPKFWSAYPKKRAKEDTLKAWRQLKKRRPPIDQLLKAIERQRESHDWLKDDGKWIPYPATWLRAGQWDDECEPARPREQLPRVDGPGWDK